MVTKFTDAPIPCVSNLPMSCDLLNDQQSFRKQKWPFLQEAFNRGLNMMFSADLVHTAHYLWITAKNEVK